MDLTTVEPGQTIFEGPMTISHADAVAYRLAVEDNAPLYEQEHVVPSMAVAALVMGAAMSAIQLPAGAVHTGQELEFARPVAEGTQLSCRATAVQNSIRRGTRFLVLDIEGADGSEVAVRGRATIVISEGGEDS